MSAEDRSVVQRGRGDFVDKIGHANIYFSVGTAFTPTSDYTLTCHASMSDIPSPSRQAWDCAAYRRQRYTTTAAKMLVARASAPQGLEPQ